MGISEERFWKMNPRKLKPYLRASEMRDDRDNLFNWMLGKYVMDAVKVSLDGVVRGVNAKMEYPDEPYRIRPYTEEELMENAERERERAIAFFNSMVGNSEDKQ